VKRAKKAAALFVQEDGCYSDHPLVDAWPKSRDARKYNGPWPVVAHPPCERWGRYWSGGPSAKIRRELGADEGCFAFALAAVREFGGVIEHPEASYAWDAFGLNKPPRDGGWVAADFEGGWTCCVEQGHYGHRARKATWLYALGIDLPSLKWGTCGTRGRLDQGYHSEAERARAVKTGVTQRLSKAQRAATPIPFRDLLIDMARSVHVYPGSRITSIPRPYRITPRVSRAPRPVYMKAHPDGSQLDLIGHINKTAACDGRAE